MLKIFKQFINKINQLNLMIVSNLRSKPVALRVLQLSFSFYPAKN
jgi:hypothetical protein